jgi:phenylpropionate dioxygenase-like ring-hydroxylating dioxygenase large terminal subunit
MKAALFKPEWYTDQLYLEKEKSNLFERVWIYAGLSSSIHSSGDYFTIEVAGKEIVVHNLLGKISSYINICPHRGGPLVLEKFGNGAPVCKYHGWSFRDGQALTGVSNLNWFNEDQSTDACSRELVSVAVELVGPAIFINLAKNPMPMSDQFSDEVLNALRGYGETGVSISTDFHSPLNWKLNIENVKDYLHPYYVHPETFKPLLEFGETKTERMKSVSKSPPEYGEDTSLKELSYVLQGDFSLSSKDQWWSGYIKRTQKDNCYQNIFLFPNTNFCSVSGAHYVIQQYLPHSPQSFNYRLTVALPEVLHKFDSKELLLALLKIERDVIKEDDVILVKVQKNMNSRLSKNHYSHGDYEKLLMKQFLYMGKEVYGE